MASSSLQLLMEWQGKIVPQSFNAGFVTLSYVVSLIGSWSTLELINRRTAIKGIFNHLLLASAAVTMGGISIWSMHYIGNRAIDIANGEPELQIAYSSGFTALSFFVPILVLLAAFVATGTNNSVEWWRVAVGGAMSGMAICGMHYIGNASISNYACEYHIANVVGSAIISVAASIIALALFFVFRSSWTASWWKRSICAVVLAGAVSGMHWCASTGTKYRMLKLNRGNSDLSRIATVVVVICLSVGACLIIAAMAFTTNQVMKRSAQKAQQVVLAVAIFDNHGRLLVSPDGLLPSEKITETFVGRSAHEALTVQHPLFQWMFRASRNWASIEPIISGMRSHLAHLPNKKGARDESGRGGPRNNTHNTDGVQLISDHGEPIENYEAVLCELFCTAAEALSIKLKVPLGNVGTLWDEILATGDSGSIRGAAASRSAARKQRKIEQILMTSGGMGGRGETRNGHNNNNNSTSNAAATEFRSHKELANMDSSELAEMGIRRPSAAAAAAAAARTSEYGRGSLMFLVRHVDNVRELGDLEAAGYRFAELRHVCGIIGPSMQIKAWNLETKLRAMQTYARESPMLEAGVHLGLFAVRAQVGGVGFDVLVDREARNLLPSVPMPFTTLEPWQLAFLRQVDHLTADRAIRHLATIKTQAPKEAYFASQLVDAIHALRHGLADDAIFDDAVLSAKVVEVPCRRLADGSGSSMAAMIALCCVVPIHQNISSETCELVPLSFFKVHQLVDPDSPHQLDFLRSLHRDIYPLINAVPKPAAASAAPGSPGAYSRRLHNLSSRLGRRGDSGNYHHHHGSRMGTARASSPSGSFKAGSTKELWTGSRPSSDTSTQPSSADLYAQAMMGGDPASLMSPIQSSFGGIMVSQEITVDVHATVGQADAADDSIASVMKQSPQPTLSTLPQQQLPPSQQQPQQQPQDAEADAADGHQRDRSQSGGSSSQDTKSELELKPAVTVAVAPIRVIRSHREEANQPHGMSVGVVANAVADAESTTATFVDELFTVCLSQR
ncbi:hypothetical protein SEPCBS119000_006326 [Sporothrix epigloea]|uniref:MHYT domain-containing protein n=1 Tax=Sporothrix epigloea TaxID=1892477 RepID=A0ABP0E5K6_9PEZI